MTWTLSGFADEAGDPIDTQIKTIADAGFSHVDLRMVEGHNIAELPEDKARVIANKLKAAGIKVGMFGSPLGKIDLADDMAIDLAKLDHLAKMADVFHTRLVRVFSYFNEKAKVDENEYRKQALGRLQQLKDRAIEIGLVLYHENERDIFGDTIAHVVQLADALHDGEHFKLIFDFDNYNQCEEDVWEAWEKLRDRTEGFHLKDSDKNCQHVPIGQGAGRAREILAECVANGWEGHIALEPHLAHSPAVMATGPGGQANQALADLNDQEAWQYGAKEARELMDSIGAAYTKA